MSNPHKRTQTAQALLQTLEEMDQHLAQINRALEQIKLAGMYDAVPSESWQTRNGTETEYLYMMFPQDRMAGHYMGPDGKRKLYVGAKPQNIANARSLAQNRAEYDHLDHQARSLKHNIDRLDYTLERLEADARHFTPQHLGKWGID